MKTGLFLLLFTLSNLSYAGNSGCEPNSSKIKEEYLTFYNNFKKAVQQNDKEKLKDMILYPLKANAKGKPLEIANAEEFIAKYEDIFTPHIRKDIENQKISKLSCNYKGVMAGNGELWIEEENGKIGIRTLYNYE